MNETCLVCNSKLLLKQANIFIQTTPSGVTLANVLSEIFEKPIEQNGVHSIMVCLKCHNTCCSYDTHKQKLVELKMAILEQFKKSLSENSLSYENIGKVEEKVPLKIELPESKQLVKKALVLPASKLQPLPPNYVINVNKLGLGNAKVIPKAMLAKSAVNLKVTVGTTVLTRTLSSSPSQTIQSPALHKIQSTATKPIIEDNLITTSSPITSTLNIKSSPILSFSMDSLPKNFLSNAVITKLTSEGYVMKQETGEVENNEEQTMEIDEGCALVQVSASDTNILLADGTEKTNEEQKEHFFDVSLLPTSPGDDVVQKLEIINEEDDDDEQTIVMAGENGSILRVMSGRNLVYENGELSLVMPDDDNNDSQDNDGQDSNDESQIELQVSGDEETANAIIAAAQEQGGAFIKVESGEMFRVKSVESKTENASESVQPLQIVTQEDGLFKCLMCDHTEKVSANGAEAITTHVRSAHGARAYACRHCSKVLRRRADYLAHMEEHASKSKVTPADKSKVHECSVCKKKYSSRTLLQEHMNVHNGTRPYVCSVCNKSFASKYTLQAHLKTHLERPRPFKCTQCDKSFFTQQNLNQHEKTHLGIKDFICNICGKAFGTQHNLEVHGVVHSGARPFACARCPKRFARRAELRDHARTHTGERPFKCETCGAAFSQRSNLHSHRRATHLDDKRHLCTHCPKRFKRRRLLEYHVKASHTGERPLQCAVCRATFVYPEHYRKHARIHSGEKPYRCEVCGKEFNSRDNRNTHRFVHSDKKPYECLVCGAGYMRKQLLYAHMNSSGHLAESIVVNQPRIHKVTESMTTSQTVVVDTSKVKALDTIFETAELELDSNASKSTESDNAPKLFLTGDKKLVLQDGKSTLNLVPDSDESTLLTFLHNLDGSSKSDGTIQGITTDTLGEPVQIATGEDGGLRLVQIHLQNGDTGWVAVNPE